MLYLSIAALAFANPVAGPPPKLRTVAEARAAAVPASKPVAADPKIAAEIRALERKWSEAFVTRDFNFLERIIAPEYRLSSLSLKGVQTITARVDWMRGSGEWLHVSHDDEVIDVMTTGDVAVAMLKSKWVVQRFSDRPAETNFALCTDTWVRRPAGWQVVYRSCTRRPPSADSAPAGATFVVPDAPPATVAPGSK